MEILEDELKLSVPTDVAFQWFKDLDKNYVNWHPPTHLKFAWLTEKPIGKDSKFYFEENINGHKHKMFMKVTEYIENEKLSFSSIKIQVISKLFPDRFMSFFSSFFRVRMEMERIFKPISETSTIIYTTHKLGCHLPIIGFLAEWFINTFIFSNKHHAEHMKEEDENMKNCLERA